jgi:hypothetical protein
MEPDCSPVTDNPLYILRKAAADDFPLFYNSWLKSYRDAPPAKTIPNKIYYESHHRVIENVFGSPVCKLSVACNPEDPNQIYGYAVGELPTPKTLVIHWVYCKHPFRGNGIARDLVKSFMLYPLDEMTIFYTHKVKNMDKLVEGRPFVYNPYLLKV